MKRTLFAAVAVSALAGCATAINGVDERVEFTTTPAGAAVTVARMQEGKLQEPAAGSCSTPCSMVLRRDVTYQATFTKDGCHKVELRLYPAYDSMFYLAVVPDFWTGAAYDVQPDPMNVKLLCGAI